MGIFSRKKPKADNSLSTTKFAFWGSSTAGTYVNETTAMQTAAVYACVKVISEAIASLPIHVYKYQQNGAEVIPTHPLNKLLRIAPNPDMTAFSFFETVMGHLLIWGNAYAQIIRDGAGRVLALYPLLPNKTDIFRDGATRRIYYTYWRDADETQRGEKTGGVRLEREDVLHIPGLSFDGMKGYSPIALARNAVGMAIATENFGASFFSNGANPSGVLESPTALKNPDELRAKWESNYKGSGKANKLVILEEGIKYHTISVPPEQAQFLETRKFQLNEIARIFRVPPHMIGDLEKSSFSNIEQQSLEFVKYCVNPWVVRLEQAMSQSLLLPSEQFDMYIKFNLDGLLRGDYETRMKGYSIGLQNGFMSPNDIRRLENMLEIPEELGGNKYMVNGNMIPLSDVGKQWGGGEGNA